MAGLGRVLVHVRRGGASSPARFGQSVTGTFCRPHEDSAAVWCRLERGHLLLSDGALPGATLTRLQRPASCPTKLLGVAPGVAPGLASSGVAVGVAVLLQASTGRILLTRRASTLRTFPNIWVPPGGHVDPGEELLEGGLRELAEETGVPLAPGTFTWQLLGLWESIYPPRLCQGPPRGHHIVTYLLLLSTECHQRLEARMHPNANEVTAYAWLPPPVLAAIAGTMGGGTTGGGNVGTVPEDLPDTVGIVELRGSSWCPVQVPVGTFLRLAPAQGPDLERVSTGTSFALRIWLEQGGGGG